MEEQPLQETIASSKKKIGKPDLKNLTDEEIIQKILGTGDIDLFSELYDRYGNKVYRKCLAITKDTHISQDLSHDILIKAFLNLSKFQGKSKFSTWLFSISYNYIIDFIRVKKKQQTGELMDYHDSPGDDDEEENDRLLKEIRISRLKEIMDQLPGEERALLLMKYQDRLSVDEIQTILNLSTSAVKMRLKRARDKVRELYTINYKNEELT